MFFSRVGHLNRPIRRLISDVLWGWRSFLTHVTEIVGSDAQRSPKATVSCPMRNAVSTRQADALKVEESNKGGENSCLSGGASGLFQSRSW